jgi:division protein CdvB (Snf7/Vps24/ESCRT-III family)
MIYGVCLLFKRKEPLRKAFEALYTVRVFRDRVKRLYSRLDERKNELKNRMAMLEVRGETYLAKRYAEEIVKLEGLLRSLSSIQLVLEKVDTALQHAIVVKEFSALVEELKPILQDLSQQSVIKSIPEMGLLLADLEESVRELADLQMSPPSVEAGVQSSSEIKAVLEEAKEILRKKLEP